MADLKDEATVANAQAEQVETTAPRKASIDPSIEGLQIFYERNKNVVNYVGGGLLLLIAALCYYKFFYMPEKENEASNEIFWAQEYFEKDSFNLALKGGPMVMSPDGQKQMMGFQQIADEYSMTKSGKLAEYYTGICMMRTGRFDEAIEHLDNYNGDDEVISSIAIGAIGDCHMELKQLDDAVKYYLKAADHSHNNFTTPYFLKKAGFAYEQAGNFDKALSTYERIRKEFPRSTEAQQMRQSVARVKAMGNL